jgi:hypothetical protein
MSRLLTVDECFAWCAREQAVVSFIFVHTVPRVKVGTPGHRFLAERDTFQEAVSDSAVMLERMRPVDSARETAE